MAKSHHRRKVERIRLLPGLEGVAGNVKVELVEISVGGARLHHFAPLHVGQIASLRFHWVDEEISIPASVIRSSVDRFGSTSAYISGVRFVDPTGSSRGAIKRLIETFVKNALDEQIRNAQGSMPSWASRLLQSALAGEELAPFAAGGLDVSDEMAQALRDEGFVRYTFTHGRWAKTKTWESQQPEDGFTIWHFEDDEQVELLCRDYESADPATRALIRVCAELSLIVDDSIPPQHFVP
ncbi:MAG: PilZ domain-containing protein [Acidobacteria bacterium]|nr:PilZ domain-containing protein [Acidobacteriota bacterium]